jgi:antirestriction protein ArdC
MGTEAAPAYEKRDFEQEITNSILASLEKGVKPWAKPWNGGAGADMLRPRKHNGQAYQGINQLWLGMEAVAKGYDSPYWLTFNQAKAYGGMVRKGEKSSLSVFYKELQVDDRDAKPAPGEDPAQKKIFMQKTYSVFNANQIEGLPAHFYPKPTEATNALDPKTIDPKVMTALDEMTAGLKLQGGYAEQGTRAFYSPPEDKIVLPPRDTFTSFGAYSGTRIHEMAHATEIPTRLDQDFGRNKPGQGQFGSTAYAQGELYAELTAAMTGAHLGYVADHIDNHAAYLGSWIKALKEDKGAIVKMASRAGKAAEHLLEHTSEFNKEKRAERDAVPADQVKEYDPDAKKGPRKGGVKAAAAAAKTKTATKKPTATRNHHADAR